MDLRDTTSQDVIDNYDMILRELCLAQQHVIEALAAGKPAPAGALAECMHLARIIREEHH